MNVERVNAVLITAISEMQDREIEALLEFRVLTPYEMHVAHGMTLPKEFITKGRKAVEAKGPRLFLSRPGGKWRIEARTSKAYKARKHTLERKKDALKLAIKLLGQLRDYGDDFVVNDGKRSYRVPGGDTLAFSSAQKAVRTFFR